jgi:DNA-directed RNA polymerase specialized sigma24 family protein
MGIPIGTLKSRLVRARLRLRNKLENTNTFHRSPLLSSQFVMN